MLEILLDNEVRFLVVGAYAMGAYGYPRATGDIDIWVESSLDNSRKVYRSLAIFGAPIAELTEGTFCEEGIVFQIGVAPRRIDLITKASGLNFSEAFAARQEICVDELCIPFISKHDLIKNKESTGREKDRLDVEYLRSSPDDQLSD
jgi:hypothetical protein